MSKKTSKNTSLSSFNSQELDRDLLKKEALHKDILLAEREETIRLQKELITQKEELITQKEEIISEKERDILEKEALIAKLSRMLFGQKRERFENTSSLQLSIDFGGVFSDEEVREMEGILNQKKEAIKKKEAATPPQSHPGRKPLPKHLTVKEIVIEPTEDVSDMVLVGKEESDSIAYEPSKVYIKRIVRPKYAPKSKEGSFVIASMPSSVFPKCMADTSLIAQIFVDKYVDHLPLYRQLQRFKREAVEINSATINNWIKLGIERLELLYEYQMRHLLNQKYLQVDETTLKVLESDKAGACHLGYLWVYNTPLGGHTLFKYEKGRGAKYPQEMMKDFSGYLQTDGYGGYERLSKRDDITHLACWAHVRRKFEEALKNDQTLAQTAMTLIQGLYQVEREAKDLGLSSEERKVLRLDKSLPIYNILGKWISHHLGDTMPKSSIGKAMRYAQERWDELGHYMLDGNLEIDNNKIENAIRPIAIGRKNYLFAGNHEAAQRAAIVYTFMSQCKQHQVNPYHWLKYVLENILDTKTSQLISLTPANLKNNPLFQDVVA